jgi:hypothetical protein
LSLLGVVLSVLIARDVLISLILVTLAISIVTIALRPVLTVTSRPLV